MMSNSLFVLCTSILAFCTAWQNNYDEPVNFVCGEKQYLSGVQSRHDNGPEDRQWQYSCTPLPGGAGFQYCLWYNNVNDYDQLLAFRCPKQQVITAVKSAHDNGPEDRTFGFRCCRLVNISVNACHITPFLNNYNGVMSYFAPNGFAIAGFYSAHDNGHEDRRWKADICSLQLGKK